MSAIINQVRISSPSAGATINPYQPFTITGTYQGQPSTIEVTLREPAPSVRGQPYDLAQFGGGVWTIALMPQELAFTRILARAIMTDQTIVFSQNVTLVYSGTAPPPPPPPGTAAVVRITSPAAGTSFNVNNFIPVSGTTTGSVSFVEVTMREPSPSTVGQSYQMATPGPNGWSTWSIAIQPESNTFRRILARATESDGITQRWHEVLINLTGTPVIPPPPPCTCAPGFHCESGVCVPDEIIPPPPPPPNPSIIDKIIALFPDALKPYAIPITMTVGALFLKKVI